ncbi:hypothetical protein CONPUDRAFT_54786, partial [Coniophora puteana RWD-64-598 SS2]
DEYLNKYIHLEGRGNASAFPCDCNSGRAREYCCESCGGRQMTCKECCVTAHQCLPLHFIQKWNGRFFEHVSLKSLGLRVNMGHKDGSKCVLRQAGHAKFVVINTNRIHRVSISFCGCDKKVPHRQQLLRYGWYPSTVDTPETACTEEALGQYSALMSRTKVLPHGYYQALESLTDSLGLDVPPSHYKVFLRILRQHRYIRLMKEAGRGNVANGIETTRPGELAVACPACPHPNVNLPDGWENADLLRKFLYCLFLTMDTNFRLKNRDRGGSLSDVELFDGLAYFVKTEPYMEYIYSQRSTCSSFRAISGVNNKLSKGLQATGVGMIMCARHEFTLALGVGDLQAGERNCNMDYLFFSIFAPLILLLVVISYDIACQWKTNLFKRMNTLPPEMQMSLVMMAQILVFGVPKFHAPGHNQKCATEHSLNLITGAGRTDGEGIERGWVEFNLASNSTKEMTLGFQHDTLNIVFSSHNLHKYYGLGKTLQGRLILAMEAQLFHQDGLLVFNESIDESDKADWTAMKVAWENNKTKENPFLFTQNSKCCFQPNNNDESLWLPSALNPDERSICTHGIEKTEGKLRQVQCHSSLNRIRGLLQTKYHFSTHQKLHSRGQRAMTRAYRLIGEYTRKIEAECTKYDKSYKALESLEGTDLLCFGLQPLHSGDIRTLREPAMEPNMPSRRAREMQKGLGEGH